MRPRELVLSGFRSYEAETRFCWDDRTLVGIVGPIGSGKSSILDGIALALYNKTPRVERDTRSLINQRRDVAQVSLTFDVEGQTYRAVRSLRRNGASAHALYRLDGDDEVPLADRAKEMTEEIEQLLGLDFAAFQRSVLLAQNQFAGFLEATGTDRNRVLKGVFGFERLDAMRSVAKERLDGLGNRLAVLADRRATAEADRAELALKRVELEAAEQRAAALDALRGPFEEAKDIIAAAERRRQDAEADLARLDTLAGRIPDREAAETLLTGAGAAGTAVSEAERVLEAASARRTDAVSALETVLEPVGGRAGLDRAADLVAAWRGATERSDTAAAELDRADRRLAEARQRAAAAATEVAAAEQAHAAAVAQEAEALQQVDGAEQAVQQARQAHRAHALRADLVVGEPCPVCEQEVGTLPDEAVPASIESAEAVAAAARARRADASVAARESADLLAQARARAESAEGAIATATADLEAARDASERAAAAAGASAASVAEVVGEGDPGAVLERIRNDAAAATATVEAAAATEAAARTALDAARSSARSAEAALGTLRTELAALAGSLGVDVVVAEAPESIGDALGLLRTEWIERRAAAAEAVPAASEAVAAGRAALGELLEAAGLGVGDDLAEVVASAVAERSGKEAAVALLEKRLADLESLAGDEADLVEQSARLERIHADLAPARFLGFVLDERRRALGDLASEHFETLSAGRYRFDESGEFLVVDLAAADATRAPASLSGGETFLASLALALALAEIVSREGGRLDAFFLDEGFGSLDPEHLDLAMSGVERLVTGESGRLVVVVSHVPALNDRIEDLIRLDRDPVTGDTRVVSGAGCP